MFDNSYVPWLTNKRSTFSFSCYDVRHATPRNRDPLYVGLMITMQPNIFEMFMNVYEMFMKAAHLVLVVMM